MSSDGDPDEPFLRAAIRQAAEAARAGDPPYGAVLVRGGQVVLEARNSVGADRDPTAHAEVNLLRRAARMLDRGALAAATVYSSAEPCAMCAAAIAWAGISRVVYGCGAARDGEISACGFVIPCRTLLAAAGRPIEVRGPLLETEAVAVLEPYWRTLLAARGAPRAR